MIPIEKHNPQFVRTVNCRPLIELSFIHRHRSSSVYPFRHKVDAGIFCHISASKENTQRGDLSLHFVN